jgi:hypothetical protein
MSSIGKLALIAGGGELPLRVLQAAQARSIPVEVIALAGFADHPFIREHASLTAALGQFGKVVEHIKGQGCDSVLFCGNVARPDFSTLKVDWRGVKLLPRIINAARKGDDALLRELAAAFEQDGLTVLGIEDVASGLLAPEACLTEHIPSQADESDVQRAIEIARLIGREDIGQGAVVARGIVLAVEAQEGTDAMLARVSGLPEAVRGTPLNRAGVLAKFRKPIQDNRLDLPTLGVATIRAASAAGLCGVVLEAGGALILDRDEVIRAANEAGLFLIGVQWMAENG